MELDLTLLLQNFLLLSGFAALVAALINVGKAIGIVPDGSAPTVSGFLNLAGFVAFVVAKVVNFDVAQFDPLLATVANLIMLVLGLLGQIGISRAVNAGIRGVPLIGYSHELKK